MKAKAKFGPPFGTGRAVRSATLHSHDEVVWASERNKRPHKICGVYFLVKDDRVVYVGQSVNIMGRVLEHTKGLIDFDHFAYVLCEPHELNALESAYIFKFEPPRNGRWPGARGPQTPLMADEPAVAALLSGKLAA